jgi:enoyl-CoA hydratase/carnithine racemase
MNTERITVETDGHVLAIGLNRAAKRNAFDLQMYSELSLALGKLQDDANLRCGVLFAHGDHFTGGIELPHWLPQFREGHMPLLPDGGVDPVAFDPQRTLRKPLVLAVQGWCLTIGIELLLATDIRVAAENTRFAQIEIKRGIYPVCGATIRLVQELGWGNAMRILLTADELSAQEALRIGLVQEVVATGTQSQRALQIAHGIARQSPVGVQATLASSRIARRDGETAAIARLLPDMQKVLESDDAAEGLKAFLERREPHF